MFGSLTRGFLPFHAPSIDITLNADLAMDLLNQGEKPVHAHNPLVQINASNSEMEETRA